MSTTPPLADNAAAVAEFWRVHNETLRLTGHNPSMLCMWMIGKGLMDTNHRALAPPTAAPINQPEAEREACAAELDAHAAACHAALPADFTNLGQWAEAQRQGDYFKMAASRLRETGGTT